jgi:hypothetical protein
MKLNKLTISTLLILFTFSINAQLIIDGQFRTRFKALHGYKTPVKPETDASYSFDQRSRISFNYTNDKYSTKFTLQDARVWGSDDIINSTGVEGNSYSFGIYEAWFDLKIKNNNRLRVGRQEWNYNDMRILSWRNWWSSGLSYDGLLYMMHNKDAGLFLDIGLSYNNDGSINGGPGEWYQDPYRLRTMNFINLEKKFNDKLSTALMFSLSGKQDTATGRTNNLIATGTHGIYLNYNLGKKSTNGLFGKFSAYYQHGSDMARISDNSTYKNISAYLINAELGYRTMDKKLEISAGIEMLSGSDAVDTTESYNNIQHSFNLQNSARFPYYGGNINQFLISDHSKVGTKGGGLIDPYFKINYKPTKKSTVCLSIWVPSLATNVYKENDDNGNPLYYDKKLGTNIDLHIIYKFNKEIIWKSGISYAAISDTKNHMIFGYDSSASDPKTLYETASNYLIWTMLIIKPKFFDNSEKK